MSHFIENYDKFATLNPHEIEALEMSPTASPMGRILEDTAGRRTFQVTAVMRSGREYTIDRGLSETGAQALRARLSTKLGWETRAA